MRVCIVASCWFSLSLHNLLTMHGHRNLKSVVYIYGNKPGLGLAFCHTCVSGLLYTIVSTHWTVHRG